MKEVVPGTSAASQDVQGLDQIIEVDMELIGTWYFKTDSAILAHLKGDHSCIPGDSEHAIDRFRVLANGRSQCHLNVRSCFIESLSLCLCLQKEHVKKLMLFR